MVVSSCPSGRRAKGDSLGEDRPLSKTRSDDRKIGGRRRKRRCTVPLGYDEGMTRLDRRSILAILATSAAAGIAGVGTPAVAQSASGRNTAVNAA